jgi:hypothetical protein
VSQPRVFRHHLHFVREDSQWRLAAKLYILEQGA